MSDTPITEKPLTPFPDPPTERQREAYDAINELLIHEPEHALTLWFHLARVLYASQPPATVSGQGALVCPHCGFGPLPDDDEHEDFRGVSLQTEWEYPGVANLAERTIKTEPSDQWNEGSGTLLYFECPICDGAFRAPDGFELVRS